MMNAVEVDYSPQQRMDLIADILAEGVLSLIFDDRSLTIFGFVKIRERAWVKLVPA